MIRGYRLKCLVSIKIPVGGSLIWCRQNELVSAGTCSYGWQSLDRKIPVSSSIFGTAGYQSRLICDTPHLMRQEYFLNRGFNAA